ncbi:hypothetical protein BAD_1372 [Bifidobacterium adolescentis ATCC 15703]|uniref:Uncharacterized protein n=1 Tax=Bifidobacterium adolescentis (strain ATCC 15703 / DSM 20083 / NCTC 11814 / E194a) TaxID=367928 RepID=A1A370_BIFAA|nr:hypothetical protein BAD_1372 [Bifidobacterium adolescentis ATCC 15703]
MSEGRAPFGHDHFINHSAPAHNYASCSQSSSGSIQLSADFFSEVGELRCLPFFNLELSIVNDMLNSSYESFFRNDHCGQQPSSYHRQ